MDLGSPPLRIIANAYDIYIQPVAKKIAKAIGADNYNVLQNNGRLAHQVVDHVSVIII